MGRRMRMRLDLTFVDRRCEDAYCSWLMGLRKDQDPWLTTVRMLIAVAVVARVIRHFAGTHMPIHMRLSVFPLFALNVLDAAMARRGSGPWRIRAFVGALCNAMNLAFFASYQSILYPYPALSRSAASSLLLVIVNSPCLILHAGRMFHLPFWLQFLRLSIASLIALSRVPDICQQSYTQWLATATLRWLGAERYPGIALRTACFVEQSALIIVGGFCWASLLSFTTERRQRQVWRQRFGRIVEREAERAREYDAEEEDDGNDGEEGNFDEMCGNDFIGLDQYLARFALPGACFLVYFAALYCGNRTTSFLK